MNEPELRSLWTGNCPKGVRIVDLSISKRKFKICVCGVPDLYDEEGIPLNAVLSWDRRQHPDKEKDTSLLLAIERSYEAMRIKKGQLSVN